MTKNAAILGNLEMLSSRLAIASSLAEKAAGAMRNDYRNLAIGAIIPFEELLPEIEALYRVIIMLHRSPESVVVSSGQSRIVQTLQEALAALNTAPCFRVPSLPDRTNSYDIASRIGKVLNQIAPPTAPP
jgi:hypothetical protein